MATVQGIPKSTVFKPEHYSESQEWDFDKRGAFRSHQETMVDVYEDVREVVQNAIDSVNSPKADANTITITVPKPGEANPKNLVIMVEDCGTHGLTKDYNGQIQDFMEDQKRKATSRKLQRKGTVGHKGVGMIQYIRIGTSIFFYSEDDVLLYEIPLYPTQGFIPTWGKYTQLGKTPENREKWNIHHPGTRVEIYDPPLRGQRIEITELQNKLTDWFGLLLARNPNLSITINDQKLEPPQYMKEHPEGHLFTLQNDNIEVRGNLWPDKSGHGVTKVIIQGSLVEDVSMSPRKCRAWIAIDDDERKLQIDTGRGRIHNNEYWQHIVLEMGRRMRGFPLDEDKQDQMKADSNINSLLNKGLARLFPKRPTAYGRDIKPTKTLQQGNLNGNDLPGYKPKTKPTKPRTRTDIIDPHTRDNNNQRKVGEIGTDHLMRSSDITSKRHEYDSLTRKYTHMGANKGLLWIYENENIYELNIDRQQFHIIRDEMEKRISKTGAYLLAPHVARTRLRQYVNNNPASALELEDTVLLLEDFERDCLFDMGMWRS